MMKDLAIRCDCGVTALNLSGTPMARGICHCTSCRALYNAAFHAGAVWQEDAVSVIQGKATIRQYKYPGKELRRYWCGECGAIVFNTNRFGYVVIPQSLLRKAHGGDLPPNLAPQMHLFYASRIVDIDDSLPKFLDGTNGPLYKG